MIFGNPYKFAIWVDKVDDWTDIDDKGNVSFIEGVFKYIIDVNFITPRSMDISQTLDVYVYSGAEVIMNLSDNENEILFDKSAAESFEFLDNLSSEENLRSDKDYEQYESYWKYRLNLLDMLDYQHEIVWCFSKGNNEKIIYKDNTGKACELILDRGYVKSIFEQVVGWDYRKDFYGNSRGGKELVIDGDTLYYTDSED